jgi:hypothetical protein
MERSLTSYFVSPAEDSALKETNNESKSANQNVPLSPELIIEKLARRQQTFLSIDATV